MKVLGCALVVVATVAASLWLSDAIDRWRWPDWEPVQVVVIEVRR